LFEFIIAQEKDEKKCTNVEQLIKHLVDSLTLYIFNQCSRSLFEDHKAIFSFFIASKICIKLKQINTDELFFFLTGVKAGFSDFKRGLEFSFLDEKTLKAVQMLDAVAPLQLVQSFKTHTDAWDKWIHEGEPHTVPMPGELDNASAFHKCLIIKALRPEKLMFVMKSFIREIIGDH